MVTRQSAQLDAVFGALADATRRQILAKLASGPTSTMALAAPFDMSLPAVSKHLGVLERAGLVHRKLVGRERRCHLAAAPLEDAVAWLETYRAFWEYQFDRLTDYLQETQEGVEKWPARKSVRPSASPSGERSRPRPSRSSRRGRPRKG